MIMPGDIHTTTVGKLGKLVRLLDDHLDVPGGSSMRVKSGPSLAAVFESKNSAPVERGCTLRGVSDARAVVLHALNDRLSESR